MEDLSCRFLINRWFAHSWYMDLENPFTVVVHHHHIGRMTSFGYRDEVPVASALVCTVTH